jgi:hypothetical protein
MVRMEGVRPSGKQLASNKAIYGHKIYIICEITLYQSDISADKARTT